MAFRAQDRVISSCELGKTAYVGRGTTIAS